MQGGIKREEIRSRGMVMSCSKFNRSLKGRERHVLESRQLPLDFLTTGDKRAFSSWQTAYTVLILVFSLGRFA
jgi:hypothetical protein